MPWIIQIIVNGFIVGFTAKPLTPEPKTPFSFVLTTVLGIVGAYLATFLGCTAGWLEQNEIAGIISMLLGAIILTFIWNRLVLSRH